jgi:hypothetical protein
LLLSQACGGDDDSGSDKPKKVESQKCQGGESFSCRSLSGCSGHQFCTSAGVLGACICDSASGASGSGGSSSGSDGGARDAGTAQGGQGGSGQAGSDSGGSGGSAGKPAEQDAGKPVEDAGHPQTGDEQCDNGKDDDGDGDIDCADDDCGSRSCLQAAPDGWDGPTALRIGSSLPAKCAGDYASEVARGGTAVKADDAECSTCTCTPENPGCADYLDFVSSVSSNCGAPRCADPVMTNCEQITSSCISGLSTGYIGAKLPAGTQSCSPSEQSPAVSDPSWQLDMLACSAGDSLVRGGCKREELCAPKLPSDAELCIVHDGDVACPDGAYSEKRTFYTGFDDSRDCSACSCAQDCNYDWKVFGAADTNCSQPALVTVSGEMCVGVTPDVDKVRVGLAITGDGSCAASGGDPTGGVDPTGPITACCVP